MNNASIVSIESSITITIAKNTASLILGLDNAASNNETVNITIDTKSAIFIAFDY